MKICTSITGWGNQTIRDLIQFAVCNIFNKCSSRFVRSLRKRDLTRSMTVYSETGLETKIKPGARTGGKYCVPNIHRNICNKSLNMQ